MTGGVHHRHLVVARSVQVTVGQVTIRRPRLAVPEHPVVGVQVPVRRSRR